jgi:hypothetical protein
MTHKKRVLRFGSFVATPFLHTCERERERERCEIFLCSWSKEVGPSFKGKNLITFLLASLKFK